MIKTKKNMIEFGLVNKHITLGIAWKKNNTKEIYHRSYEEKK